MKIYALLVYSVPPGGNAVPLSTAWKLDDFGWLQRGTVQDVIGFMSKTVAERTSPTQRQSVQENTYVAHVHARPASEGITGVLVSDADYPVRVAYSLLNKILDEFLLKVPKVNYERQVNALTTGGGVQPAKGEGVVPQGSFPQIAEYVQRYQDPRQADAIMKVQQELDETKIVLVSRASEARVRLSSGRRTLS
ncbi:putative YKT6-snare protein for endoplasmic reticulum-golgi transport [Jaminaea rosea]|uniref:Putative YKT6-snare protein for endoplasmic reticulum-golgi transport n=1 Tax=Jaminaea rosea TaxID=1569628 RepID=A0A316UJC0_9BASI|nr:putative YKT6-snare protein for endoplasmic reticulum-golgi transport [Jaminaea rosea]PWN24441.1 putative YKT6-snare protein for endoplasmic reticulum-golgi transport [Jaminaea rosea]